VHAAAVGTGDLRGCDGWTGGGEGSLDERRRGKAGSGQRVRCDGRRDEGCSQQQQGTAEKQDDSLRCNRRARKGQRDSGQWTVAAYRIPLVVLAAVARPSKSRTDSGTARAPPDWPHRVASSNQHGHGSLMRLSSHTAAATRVSCGHIPIPADKRPSPSSGLGGDWPTCRRRQMRVACVDMLT
jgi:hypothetical protein